MASSNYAARKMKVTSF